MFVILAPLAALISISVAAYARLRYPSMQSASLVWLNVPTTGWLVANTLEVIDPTQAGTLFWSRVTYAFIAFTAVAWLGFALRFTNREGWLRPRRLIPLMILPLITQAIVWTNGFHHWLWEAIHFTPVAGMLAINVDYGWYFWVHSGYSYLLVFTGAFLIIRHSLYSLKIYRWQSIWVVFGALVPIVFNIVHIFHLIPGLRKDFTALGFALAGLAFAIAIFNYHLFDLRPVARDALIDNLPDAMLVFDLQNRLVDFNPAACSLLGLQNFQVGIPAMDVFAKWRDTAENYRERYDAHEEIKVIRDGVETYLNLDIFPLKDHRKRESGRLVMLRDITSRKQTEAELVAHTKELEASNAELDAFAHTVAHDLKSPLAALTASSSLLRERLFHLSPADAQRMLDIVVSNSQKMGNIIDELLLLASVRRLSQVTIVPLDMNRLINQTMDRLSVFQVRHHGEIIRPEHWPVALGYSPWVEEIWVNYISNALKYGGEKPKVELGAEIIDDSNPPLARFWVRDNGPGVPPDAQQRIFRPFNRLELSRTDGHGLGLSIVLRIVEKLGGQAGVESELGRGSTFWFTLPAVLPRADQPEPEN
ncbi:MAG: PAS domain S-box protein [Anaerolineales bacterium]|nr:PAS domain S-box protein [Anaerolineales bacterium]